HLKEERTTQLRLKRSNLPVKKTLKEFDFGFQRSVTREQMLRLTDCSWIDEAYNIMFLGPPSVGKTHLATALAYEALERGYSVSFVILDDLIRLLKTDDIATFCMNIPVDLCSLSGILEHPVPEIRAGVFGTECTSIKLKSNHTF